METIQFAAPQPVTLDNTQAVLSNATVTSSGNAVVSALGTVQVALIINITAAPTGTSPTLQFTIVEVDPVDGVTTVGTPVVSNVFNAAAYQVIELTSTKSSAFKVSWTIGGTSGPTFTGVNVSVSSKSGGGGGSSSNASVGLINNTAPSSATFVGGYDETTGNMLPICLGTDAHVAITQDTLAGFAGMVDVWTSDTHTPPATDAYGAQYTRGQVMTDEGSFFDDFPGSALTSSMTGTLDFTNGSTVVVGHGTLFRSELDYYSVIKKSGDADTLFLNVANVVDDTHLTLVAPYQGTTQSGQAGIKSRWITAVGTGASLSVASSLVTIAAGTTSGSITGFWTVADYGPFLGALKVAVDNRRANQNIYIGWFDVAANPQPNLLAAFLLDGTTNTLVKCVSSTSSAAADTQGSGTTYTLPNAVISSASNTYRIAPWQGQIAFYVNDSLVAVNTQHILPPYADVRLGVYVVNTGVPAGATGIVTDSAIYESIDRFDVRAYNANPDLLQMTANGRTTTGVPAPIQVSAAGIVTVTGVVTSATAANLKAQVVGISLALADAASNTELVVQGQDFLFGFNGTTWDRLRAGVTNVDAEAVEATGGDLVTKDRLYGFNGTTWDRLRSSVANGLLVDVSRVTGTVSIQGTGTAGSPAGNLLTVQGSASGTPIPVSGSFSALNVGLTGQAVPTSAGYGGMLDSGGFLRGQATITTGTAAVTGSEYALIVRNPFQNTIGQAPVSYGALMAGTDGSYARAVRVASDGTVRVDPTGTTTQPVSGAVTANQGTPNTGANAWFVKGAGTAGTPDTNVVTIQGIASGTTVPVSGTVTSTVAAVGLNGQAIPTSSIQIGGSDGTYLRPLQTVQVNGALTGSEYALITRTGFQATVGSAPPAYSAFVAGTDGSSTRALHMLTASTAIAGTEYAALMRTAFQATNGGAIPNYSALMSGSDGTYARVLKVDSSGVLAISATALPLPTGAATETTLGTRLADATFTGRINTLGQKTMANSTPVVLASDQASIPVTFSGTVDVSDRAGRLVGVVYGSGTAGTPAGGVLTVQGATGMTAVKVDGSAVTQPVSGTFWQATQPVSAASLPLPAGASTEATLANVLTTTAFQARIPVNGQALMAASVPVVLASNQSAVPVSGTFWQATQPVSAASLPLPTGAATETTLGTRLAEATFTTRIPVNGQALMAASVPVAIASNQSALPVTGTFWQATQPVSGTVTAAQATAANLNATVTQGPAGASAWKVDGSAVTQPISAASLPLPSGAATAAKQPALGTAGTPSADVISVQGVTGGTPVTTSNQRPANATQANVAQNSSTPQSLLASNAARKKYTVFNDSTAALLVSHAGAASPVNFKYKILAGQTWTDDFPCFSGAVSGVWASGTGGAARVTEEF